MLKETLKEDIVGVNISTRPDCVTDEQLDYLLWFQQETGLEITLELELQTVNPQSLKKICRGHGVAEYVDYQRLRQVVCIAGRLVRVDPDRRVDAALPETMGHPDRLPAVLQVAADDHHAPDPGLGGTADERVGVLPQLVGVEMAVGVNQHGKTSKAYS